MAVLHWKIGAVGAYCQRRSERRPLRRSKSRPVAAMRYGEGARGVPFYIGGRSRLGVVDFAGIGIHSEAGFLSELLPAACSGVFQTIGVAVHLQDMNVVGQPIEQRAS